MKIIEIKENKKQFLPLLLLADEQENMIDRYIDRGTMYVLDDHGMKCECIVTDEGNGILEIKNIATEPEHQGKGYGKALLLHLTRIAVQRQCRRMEWAVLDWNAPSIAFYKSLGAVPMDEWTVFRLTEEQLHQLAQQTL